ncbi:DUF1638 domain-containing protein [Youxingia wuxianensis]|uniref:DUF1638 domain-containing protein n=1 Tax=Youxingia wuxianensis TaxID=2763678 RepID=A0A926II73_9FIRM|nr:DUF1638 domain-containing protein [Youxingia wuxianensis]MBC8585900.1 DUF1638 domain-containing protein [Youxingia wuxianensis]
MKLSLLACSPLQPYLSRLLDNCPNQVDVTYLPQEKLCAQEQLFTAIKEYIDGVRDSDGIILTTGVCGMETFALQAGEVPLIIPRVHNCISLILGNADHYRAMFEKYSGNLAWYLPSYPEILFCGAKEDCQCLAYLADTQLNIPDSSLSARVAAAAKQLDFIQVESDSSLLARLVYGKWCSDDILVTPPHGAVTASFDRRLITHFDL